MTELLTLWGLLLLAAVVFTNRARLAGPFVMSYFVGLSIIHVPGAMNFISSANGLPDRQETILGFRATLIALFAFLLGVVAMNVEVKPTASATDIGRYATIRRRLSGAHLAAYGAASFFVGLPVSGYVPSLSSLVSALGGLLILGLWAYYREASLRGQAVRAALVFAALPLLPLLTLAAGGFIGYGIYWSIALACFIFVYSRYKAIILIVAPLALWIGLSIGVAYFAGRDAIRDAIWIQNAGFGDRVARIGALFGKFELYDPNNPDHARPIDDRLNQNYLVGVGIRQHEDLGVPLLYGSSVPMWAFVPRAIWPEKPDVGGGRQVVADFTGVRYAKGTSVGAGQVLEFYANFGWLGIVVGFFLLGALLTRLDKGIRKAMNKGDLRGLLLFGLPGLALLQPGGNALEIAVAVAAAVILSRVLASVHENWSARPSLASTSGMS